MAATSTRDITITLTTADWTALRDGILSAAQSLDGPGWCLHLQTGDDEICATCAENIANAQDLHNLARTLTTSLTAIAIPADGPRSDPAGLSVTLSAFDWPLAIAGLNQAASWVVDTNGSDCTGCGVSRVCAGCRDDLRRAVQWCLLAERVALQVARSGRLVTEGGGFAANR